MAHRTTSNANNELLQVKEEPMEYDESAPAIPQLQLCGVKVETNEEPKVEGAAAAAPRRRVQVKTEDEVMTIDDSAPIFTRLRKRGPKQEPMECKATSRQHTVKTAKMEEMTSDDEGTTIGRVNNFRVKKEEPDSREGSILREINVLDGRMKGCQLTVGARNLIESQSRVIYQFPCFSAKGQRTKPRNGRVFDLVLDGEALTEENVEDKDYVITAILFQARDSDLIMWEGSMFPTWEKTVGKGTAVTEYIKRWEILDPLFKNYFLNVESMHSMRMNYSNTVIRRMEEYGASVQNPGIVYLSGLRKREIQLNEFIDHIYNRSNQAAGPTLLFVDCTLFMSHSSIPDFEYVDSLLLSPSAARFLGTLKPTEENCTCPRRADTSEICCASKASRRFGFSKKGEDESIRKKPKRKTLVVFMSHKKGWACFAAEDIKKGSFVGEHTGELLTANEAAKKRDTEHQFEIAVKTKQGSKRTMILEAKNKGNECRYFSHSCDANLSSFTIISKGIDGAPTCRVGHFANRSVNAGEELTVNYYEGITSPEQFNKICKFTCHCGSSNCLRMAYHAQNRRAAAK